MAEERRVVSVLFADVVGSTGLGEDLDPEDVRALMARYYAAAQRAVGDHGGTLEKFIGDAVMAVFGLPRAHGDDAERALAAAIALRTAIQDDPALAGLQLRFGVATGEVVASRDPAGADFLVTGDAVNVAARLQQAAEPWEILATERTAFDAGDAFRYGGVRELPLKGRAGPVAARSLLGAGPGRRGRRDLGFVGREDELDQLRLTARRALRDRSPAVVSIVAAAGTGKTRLVEEFTSTVLPDLAPAARIETAQCLPYGRQLTYWPLRSVLFELASIPEDVPVGDIVSRLEAWLGERRPAELLAATVGAEDAETAAPTELFAAWRTALAKAAADRPLVIVFEDLHWSSDSLLDLVEFVMDPQEHVPVLTVAIARPELIDRRPAWGGGRRNFVSLYLEPLPDSDVVSIVAPLLEGAPDQLVREVVRRSEGNPFFAGELARAAVEAGGVALPDTVQATVLARLDLLDQPERRVLQVASVLGRSFRAEGLTALEPGLKDGLDEHLEALRSRDLLRRQGAEQHVFRHILIRDVAYSTLPRSERARLHAEAGAWFESRSEGREDAVAEIVAFHYREAASHRGPEEVRRKAAEWLARAGDAAIRAAATQEAAAHLRAALDFSEPGDESARLWSRLGEVLTILPGGSQAYRRAYEAAVSPEVRLQAISGALMTGMRWLFDASFAEVLPAMVAEGERLTNELGDAQSEARFRAALSFRPHWNAQAGRPLGADVLAEARGNGERALELAERLDLPDVASIALDGLSSVSIQQRDWRTSRELSMRRQALAGRLSAHESGDADHMVTWASFCLGEPEAGLAAAEGTLSLARTGLLPEWRLSGTIWRLRGLLTLGRWDEALEFVRGAIAQVQQLLNLGPPWVRMSLPYAWLAAQGRGDGPLADDIAAAVRACVDATSWRGRTSLAVVADDPIAVRDQLIATLRAGTGRSSLIADADALCYLADRGRLAADDRDWLGLAAGSEIVPLRVQGLRGLGLASPGEAELAEGLALARSSSDVPATARLSVELGRRRQDGALVEAGRAALAAMGDQEQLDRYGLG